MTEIMVVQDLRGDWVKVGDTIAYAATDGRSGGIRVGKVIEIVPAHESKWGNEIPPKLKVDVGFSSGYWVPGKPTVIDSTLKRFVKIGS